MSVSRYRAGLYVKRAREMLQVAARNLTDGFDGSAINRAYYAIFYAANALLATQDLEGTDHLEVIVAFRDHFVKTGLIQVDYSRLYKRVMDTWHTSDYEIEVSMDARIAGASLHDARRFVERVEEFLQEEGGP